MRSVKAVCVKNAHRIYGIMKKLKIDAAIVLYLFLVNNARTNEFGI